MTTSAAETRLIALLSLLESELAGTGAEVARVNGLPARIPEAGIALLRDGDPGVPEVTLSPLTYHYAHRAEVDILVDLPDAQRDAGFDALRLAIGAALASDRTLGGLCDWIEAEAPAPLAIPVEGAETLKAATITVVMQYDASDPLG